MNHLERFAMVGSGALGSVLSKALVQIGLHQVAQVGRGTLSTIDDTVLQHVDVVLLCVPDDMISVVAGHLAVAGSAWNGRVVLHTSGSRDASDLNVLTALGAESGSFHPIQTFPARSRLTQEEDFDAQGMFAGITVGVEGTSQAVAVASHLAESLLANPVHVTADQKVLYHTAAVMGGNFAISLMRAAGETWDTGVHGQMAYSEALAPLIRQSVSNALDMGPEAALSGPFARGDVQTVGRQLEMLEQRLPHLVPLYGALAVETVHLAQKAGLLHTVDAVALLDVIHTYLQDNG